MYPEQIREYQYGGLLPEELDARIIGWEEEMADDSDDNEMTYQFDLSLAPGWKVGGFANWSLTDPYPVTCTECGTAKVLGPPRRAIRSKSFALADDRAAVIIVASNVPPGP